MSFSALSPRLQQVADSALLFCKQRYGKAGLTILGEIDDDISWRPTFFLKPSTSLILAVEVSNTLYPAILKIAAHDIVHFDFPIAVVLACPLDAYLADTKQQTVRELKSHGFGILTVDISGRATLQSACVPLAQQLSEGDLIHEVKGLPPKVKAAFLAALSTYQTNPGQGLQAAGQIVEALINAIAAGAIRKTLLAKGAANRATADLIDDLYVLAPFKPDRAALGGARDFAKEFRNTASHPARNAKQGIQKIRKCRGGFLAAVGISHKLCAVLKSKGYTPRIHIT